MFSKIAATFFSYLEKSSIKEKEKIFRDRFNIHRTARLGYIPQIVFSGNIEIGANSYFNSGKIYTGAQSSVQIGKWCAIGYNVNIHAITHDPDISTGIEKERPLVEKSVMIGDHVWIGSNVFILPGVTIGNNCVIGANSVVTKDIPSNSIFAGIPAKIIRMKSENSIDYYNGTKE